MGRSRIITTFEAEDRASSVITRVSRGVGNFARAALSPTGMIAAAAAIGAGLVAVTKNYLDNADALSKLSQRTGIQTTELGALRYAYEQADLTVSDLEKTYSRLNQAGLSIDDVADRVSGLNDVTDRTNYLIDIFGRNLGPRLTTVLEQGSAGLDRYRQQHQDLGLAIDQGSADAAAKFNDNLDTISRAVGGFGQRVGQAVVNWAAPLVEGAGRAFGVLPQSAVEQSKAAVQAFRDRLQEATAAGLEFGKGVSGPVIIELQRMAREAGISADRVLYEIERAKFLIETEDLRESVTVAGRRRTSQGALTVALEDDARVDPEGDAFSRQLIEGFGNQANLFREAQAYFQGKGITEGDQQLIARLDELLAQTESVGLIPRGDFSTRRIYEESGTAGLISAIDQFQTALLSRAAALSNYIGGGQTSFTDPFGIGGGAPARFANAPPLVPGADSGDETVVGIADRFVGAGGGIKIDGQSLLDASKATPMSVFVAGVANVGTNRQAAAFSFNPAGQLENQSLSAYWRELRSIGLL